MDQEYLDGYEYAEAGTVDPISQKDEGHVEGENAQKWKRSNSEINGWEQVDERQQKEGRRKRQGQQKCSVGQQ